MSLKQVGNKTYAAISDLPELQSLVDGDQFIVHTTEGTGRFDYANLYINLDHTTFKDEFNTMYEFVTDCKAFVTEVTDNINTIQNAMEDVQDRTSLIENYIPAIIAALRIMYYGTQKSGYFDDGHSSDSINEAKLNIIYNKDLEEMSSPAKVLKYIKDEIIEKGYEAGDEGGDDTVGSLMTGRYINF